MHSHSHEGGTGQVLKWSTVATLLFVALEVVAGLQAHSLALLSDAGHNLTDAMALLFTWFAFYLQSKPANSVKTYGYHRMGVLAAFLNALTLVVLSVWIFYESFQRFLHPAQVQETVMIAVAAVGLLMNSGIMWGLRNARKNDINVRSSFVHMMGDALGTLAIIAGAIVIHYTGWQQIDPALSVAIGVLIVWTAWDIVNEALNILLEGLPRGLELELVICAMREVPGVLDVHDLHILESRLEHPCPELSRADRRCAAFRQRPHPAVPERRTMRPLRNPPHHSSVRARRLCSIGKWLRDPDQCARPSSTLNSDRSQLHKIFSEPYLKAFRSFFALCPLDSAFSSVMVGLRRELSHRELPDGKLPAPAIIVSFGVAAHCDPHSPKRKRGESWQQCSRTYASIQPQASRNFFGLVLVSCQMALGDLTKQLVLDAMRQPDPAPVADSGNVGATILGQLQAMQKALKEDQELVVLCNTGGETIRVLEFFLPSWQVAVLTGLDSGKSISRVISPVESLQLVCKVVKAPAKPTRINFITPKPKSE